VRERDRGPQVDLDRAVDVFGPQHCEPSTSRQRGVRNEHVDHPDAAKQPLDLLATRQISLQDLCPKLVRERRERVGSAPGQHEL
jgi:hypothetical protein